MTCARCCCATSSRSPDAPSSSSANSRTVSSMRMRVDDPLPVRCRRLLRPNELTRSITSSSLPMPALSATADSRSNPPAKIDSRRISCLSRGSSKLKLQPTALRMDRCRSVTAVAEESSPSWPTCRRRNSALGSIILIRDAASSMASGKPSSLRQTSTSGEAMSSVRAKSGWNMRTRSTNMRMLSKRISCAGFSCAVASGRESGCSGYSRSGAMPSGSRLVTMTFSRVQACSRSWISDRAGMTCSKLSSSRSIWRWPIAWIRLSRIERSGFSSEPTVCAMAGATSSGTVIAASCT